MVGRGFRLAGIDLDKFEGDPGGDPSAGLVLDR